MPWRIHYIKFRNNMNVLYNIINRIENLLVEIPHKLNEYSEDKLSRKPEPDKWSKKEILGHLCDSALNNLSRFIRAQFEPEPFVITGYNQDDWVKMNHYMEMTTENLLNYWVTLNKQIIHVISNMPGEKLAIECIFNGTAYREPGGDNNLLWLFEDYLAHMEYHLTQIVNS